jgi:hypothetical protein
MPKIRNNKTKTFEDAVEILSNLGFKQETDYVKTMETCVVRFKKGDYFALVYKTKKRGKTSFLISYGNEGDLSSAPKTGAKPGPKPSADPKRKIVVFIEASKIEKLGGDVMVRKLFEETATETAKLIGGVSGMVDNSGSMSDNSEVIKKD